MIAANKKSLEAKIIDLVQTEFISDATSVSCAFPIEVFPNDVQALIKATRESLNFPTAYVSASVLFTASVAIGNSVKAIVKPGWIESAIIYILNVGSPGTNKTPPAKFILKPLFDSDLDSYNQYKREKRIFEECISLSKKERIEAGLGEPIKPSWKKHIISDFTPEALIKVHQFNYRGLGVYTDEALAWISNFNRYNKGSENQFWLSNFSAAPINIDRKGDDPILIQNPFISVLGSIQPSMLQELSKDNRGSNGFTDRILFAYPENLNKEYWTDNELDPKFYNLWNKTVQRITSLRCDLDDLGNPISSTISFSPEAANVIKDWQRKNTDMCNACDERTQSVYSKLEIFTIRFALILQVLKWACNEGDLVHISAESARNAIVLTEYFRGTAMRANALISQSQNAIPINKKNLLNELSNSFTTHEGVEKAKILGIPERTFKDWLKDNTLFEKIEHGVYRKIK